MISDDADRLAAVARLLATSNQEILAAHRLLQLLGDPLRRRVFEHLARRILGTRSLADILAADYGDVRHRMDGLHGVGALFRTRDHLYGVDPLWVDTVRKYIDLLLTLSAFTQGDDGGRRAH